MLHNPVKGTILKSYNENLSYFDTSPITMPDLGNSVAGMRSFLNGLSFSRAIQRKKSTGLSFPLLNTQTPYCSKVTGVPRLNFLFHKCADFTSIIFPFQSKSQPFLLNIKCLASSNLAAYFSHFKPIPVSVFQKSGFFAKYDLQLGLRLRTYHACLIQITEQYFFLFFGIALLQNKQKVVM